MSQDNHSKFLETAGKIIVLLLSSGSSLAIFGLLAHEGGTLTTEDKWIGSICMALIVGMAILVVIYMKVASGKWVRETLETLSQTQKDVNSESRKQLTEELAAMESKHSANRTRIEQRYETALEHYEAQLQRLKAWYYSHLSLGYFEKTLPNASTRKIWVVSKRLEYEKDDGLFAESIRANLARGWCYEYIIPNDEDTMARARLVKQRWTAQGISGGGTITIKCIAQEDFDYLTDVIVYNPWLDSQTASPDNTAVFMELVTNEDPRERGWLRLPHTTAYYVMKHFERDFRDAQVCP